MNHAEDMSEEDICLYHLQILRRQYERDAEPWVKRITDIRARKMPSYLLTQDEIRQFQQYLSGERAMTIHEKTRPV